LEPEFETLLIGGTKYEEEESSEFILENLGVTPVIIPEMQRKITLTGDLKAYKKIKKIIQEYKSDNTALKEQIKDLKKQLDDAESRIKRLLSGVRSS